LAGRHLPVSSYPFSAQGRTFFAQVVESQIDWRIAHVERGLAKR
jgi:hypothetical protein